MRILAKISFHNVKVDFPLILLDLNVCYNELSFERNSKIPIYKKV